MLADRRPQIADRRPQIADRKSLTAADCWLLRADGRMQPQSTKALYCTPKCGHFSGADCWQLTTDC